MTRRKDRDLNKTSRSESGRSEKVRTYRWGKRKGQPKAHPRLRQRALEVRRRPWRAVAVLGVVLALVGAVVFLFGFSTVFEVEEVTVTGADGEIAQQAQSVAETNLGRPLARVDASGVEEAVLEDPRIAGVDVSRDWPTTLTLDLTLREPALAMIKAGTRGFVLADADGVVFDTVEEAPAGVPKARVNITGDDLNPEDLIALQGLRAALPESVRQEARDLTLAEPGVIQITIGNIEVIWGDGSNGQLKGRALEALLEQEGIDPDAEVSAAGPVVIDLTTPTTPVVTGLSLVDPEA